MQYSGTCENVSGFMPFHKQCSTDFPKRLHALAPLAAWRKKYPREKKVSRKGAENAKAAQGYACLSALSGLARKNIPREEGLSQRRGERQGCAEGMHALAPFAAWREKYPARNEALAKARRTQRNTYNPCTDRYVEKK